MPNFARSLPGEMPPVGDPAFDALLDRTLLPGDAGLRLRPVAEALAALNGAPLPSELAAEARARAAFRSEMGPLPASHRARCRRRPARASLLSAKFAAAAVAAAVGLGGAAAAAYAGALPASIQRLAHDTIGAPATRPGAQPPDPATPVRPPTSAHKAGKQATHHGGQGKSDEKPPGKPSTQGPVTHHHGKPSKS
jgi:hypothetical protein